MGTEAQERKIIEIGVNKMDKKNILTYEGLKKLEDELQDLKVVKRKEVAQKIKEARMCFAPSRGQPGRAAA